jgi:hypothetical protein
MSPTAGRAGAPPYFAAAPPARCERGPPSEAESRVERGREGLGRLAHHEHVTVRVPGDALADAAVQQPVEKLRSCVPTTMRSASCLSASATIASAGSPCSRSYSTWSFRSSRSSVRARAARGARRRVRRVVRPGRAPPRRPRGAAPSSSRRAARPPPRRGPRPVRGLCSRRASDRSRPRSSSTPSCREEGTRIELSPRRLLRGASSSRAGQGLEIHACTGSPQSGHARRLDRRSAPRCLSTTAGPSGFGLQWFPHFMSAMRISWRSMPFRVSRYS